MFLLEISIPKDLLFVMGTTGPEYIADFKLEKEVVKAIINQEDISEKATLVSVILYGGYDAVAIPLGYIKNKNGLINNIDFYLRSSRGTVDSIAESIRKANEQVVASTRPDVAKHMFLFLTDQVPDDLLAKLAVVRSKGVNVVIIAIGDTLKRKLDHIKDEGVGVIFITKESDIPGAILKILEKQKPGGSFIIVFIIVLSQNSFHFFYHHVSINLSSWFIEYLHISSSWVNFLWETIASFNLDF